MKKYVIIKNKKKIKTKIAGNKISGYRVLPKNSFEYPGIKVESLIIIKPSLIEKLLKKKRKEKKGRGKEGKLSLVVLIILAIL